MGSTCCGCPLSGGQCTRAKCNDIVWILKSCNQILMSLFKPYDCFLVSIPMYKRMSSLYGTMNAMYKLIYISKKLDQSQWGSPHDIWPSHRK